MTIEDNAFYRLGGLAAEADFKGPDFEANISACYVLGASERYGKVPAWADIAEEHRAPILEALADCPNALALLAAVSASPSS